MRTALITGAGGFIGGYVVREFLEQGWRVVAVIHRARPEALARLEAEGRITLVRADLTRPEALRQVFPAGEKGELDAIIHCAGRASDVGHRRAFRRANFDAVRSMARLVMESPATRLVFLSTTDVYGLRDFHGEPEEALPLQAYPRNPYPEFKIAAEQWIAAHLPPRQYAILRPAQVWGVGDTTLTRRIVDFLRGSPWIVHFGRWRGGNRWPLAHVRNVAAACYAAATEPAAAGTATNILDDERTTMDDWYRLVAQIYLPDKRFRTVTLPRAAGALIAWPVEWISSALNLPHPLMDPTYYALHAVSANLDFSNRRLHELLASAGRQLVTREEGVRELRAGFAAMSDPRTGR